VRNVVTSLRILIKTEFFKTLINLRVVRSQNEHNSENQRKSIDKELCEYYYHYLHKKTEWFKTSHSLFS
jgi:hypothetical protein